MRFRRNIKWTKNQIKKPLRAFKAAIPDVKGEEGIAGTRCSFQGSS